ncbi:MAG: hypothetical protein J7M19_04520 [Planctomycetes bacterium]|nr:hypothetical protein [Planctomycetota bacterium]
MGVFKGIAKTTRVPAAAVIVLLGLAVGFLYPCDPIWRQKSPIDFDISEPDDGACVLMNHKQNIKIYAQDIEDLDEFSDDGGNTWYERDDDCFSGGGPDDYHVIWSTTDGDFDNFYGGVHHRENVGYALIVSWYAPGELENPVKNVTFYVTSDDIQRGDDTAGYDDDPVTKTFHLNAWRIDITAKTSDTTTEEAYNNCYGWWWNDPGFGEGEDANILGYVEPNDPTGCGWWAGKIELKGTIPSDVPEAKARNFNYKWRQEAHGSTEFRERSSHEWSFGYDYRNGWHNDDPLSKFADVDPMSPSPPVGWEEGDPPQPMPNQTYTRQLFMSDNPGFFVGVDKTCWVDWDDMHKYDMDFRSFVVTKGDCLTASNIYYWQFTGGRWETEEYEPDKYRWKETTAPTFP